MAPPSWETCPEPVRRQVMTFVARTRETLGDNLQGIYLHGSLALGGFNEEKSDVDLLGVTGERLSLESKRQIIESLLETSSDPCPIEVSFLRRDQLWPWRYPTPYELHYSEDWRDRFQQALSSNDWRSWNDNEETDPDLAAHLTMTRARGVRLFGQEIETAIPIVPAEDYRSSLLDDLAWALERVETLPVYSVLNACRVQSFLVEGRSLLEFVGSTGRV